MSQADDSNSGVHRDTGWSRRWFLAGGAAVVVGGGVGVGTGFLQPASTPAPAQPPAALIDAIAAERRLLALAAQAAQAARRDPALGAEVTALTRDHTAHLRALQSALATYDAPRGAATIPPTAVPTLAPATSVRPQLRAAERTAAAAAAARAARLTGPTAVLLASIAACESTHVELLT